jgi:superfamily II DNA/RNA helicase
LLPDILVCTQEGQEGIDLHRHCRHVVHYDLGWNPATLEQRTGRTDRLGSKALRERNLALLARKGTEDDGKLFSPLPGLDIALPYLAGTYDERMYDRLRSRAQTFEILTGGDPSADREGDASWLDPDDLGNATGTDYVQLPNELLEQLRVNLAVDAATRHAV